MDPPGIGRISVKYIRNSAEVPGRVESHEPGENALIPDKYASDDTTIQPILTSLDANESTGFDPYNSSSFDTSKLWESHARYKRVF